MAESVSIIGAGIGGLTTALTLKQRGFNVTIYEAAAAIRPVGAGIILANNAMQVFQKLGIHTKIEKAGNRISAMRITDTQLNPISVVDLTAFEKKYGVHNIAIHRGQLQTILAGEVGFDNIRLSKRLAKIEKTDHFKLIFEDGSATESGLIIGADGIKSMVRNQVFGECTIRYARQTCWRGLCETDLPKKYHHAFNEAWGKGKRFGFGGIGGNKVYWFALTSSDYTIHPEADLSVLFNEFHPEILKLISSTDKDQIVVNDIMDLKPLNKWQSKNVCLIGDAAHATTPNLGQGACQAIEDAYVLGKLLDNGMAIESTFQAYENIRRKKAHKIVNTSWMLGKVAHWNNPLLVWLRNTALRMTPGWVNKKQMNGIFELD
jgi:2-polyprenyl-6-methoxyphenol hydroxylase-like FAD-dependent oxidoreductase